jgi:uncharacterized membrane protein
MDFFLKFSISLIVIIGAVILPWVNLLRISSLRAELKDLKTKLGLNEQKPYVFEPATEAPAGQDDAMTPPAASVQQEPEKPEESIPEKPAQKPRSSVPTVPAAVGGEWVKTARESFEQNITTKLPVWVGAVCLIFAAFFLVKYSIELGWMSPFVRVLLGGLFGAVLLSAGQIFIKRPDMANSVVISQGLVGAGLVALYVSIYAALNLYALVPPLFGFAGMVIVTALAVILSLRHGQPIAVFGLIGGLLTPALVGSEEPDALAMFAYLFFLFTGMFAVLVRKEWWVLAVAAVIGVFAWSIFWFCVAFSAADSVVLVIFALAIAAVVLSVTGKHVAEDNIKEEQKLPLHSLNFAAIIGGVLTITWLSFKITLTLFDWSMLGILSLALMVLSYFQPHIYRRPLWVKLAATLFLYFIWAQDAPLSNSIAVLAGLAAVYVGGGAFLMRKVSDPRSWAGLQAIAVISLYLIAHFSFTLPAGFLNSFGVFWGIASLILASLAIYQASEIRQKYKADPVIEEHLVAIFSLLASALIAAGLAIELPWGYVPLALSAQTAVTAFIYQQTKISFLKQICIVLTLIFAGLHYEQILLFSELIVQGYEGRTPDITLINKYILDAPLVKLGIPSALFATSFFVFFTNKNDSKALDHVLGGTALTLALMTFYYLFSYFSREGYGSAYYNYALALATPAGFIERGIFSLVIGASGFALMEALKRLELPHLKPWVLVLIIMAAFRYIYFDLLHSNPYWVQDQKVGALPLLNGITLTYGGAALLSAWAVYSKDLVPSKIMNKVLGFVSLFAFSTLTVTQYFHGETLSGGEIVPAELYGYSLAWLLTGIALLTIGIIKQNRTARMASFAFIIAAVLKAFLFDAAELEGLYRVFSFLGLGICLIGLSYFYSKFVIKKEL